MEQNKGFNYDFINTLPENIMASNRLFCTFSKLEDIDQLVIDISKQCTVMYGKMFILESENEGDEYMCTYNVDSYNTQSVFPNTIMVHRKKEFNVLYSINALNELVKSLNNGKTDPGFKINWDNYKNSILLTNANVVKQVKTKVHKIVYC